MNDSDVIKAFETFLNKRLCFHCIFPHKKTCFECGYGIISTEFYQKVFNLIKRQKTENNDLSKEIERLDKLLIKAKDCICEIEYAVDKVGISNDRIDDAITEWYSFEKEPSKE